MTKTAYEALPELLRLNQVVQITGMDKRCLYKVLEKHPEIAVQLGGMRMRYFIKAQLRIARILNIE
jgi:predicted DNA-binding transcriptional regulator AlpA